VKNGHFPSTGIGSRHKESGFNRLLNLRKARVGQASHEINSLPGGGRPLKLPCPLRPFSFLLTLYRSTPFIMGNNEEKRFVMVRRGNGRNGQTIVLGGAGAAQLPVPFGACSAAVGRNIGRCVFDPAPKSCCWSFDGVMFRFTDNDILQAKAKTVRRNGRLLPGENGKRR